MDERWAFRQDDALGSRYPQGQRYEVIVDPMDQFLVWDHQTGMPAILHGHVLFLPEERAKAVADMLNEGRLPSAGDLEALMEKEEATVPALGLWT